MIVDIYEDNDGRHTHYADVETIMFIPSDRKGNIGYEFVKICYTDDNLINAIDYIPTKSITRVAVKESLADLADKIHKEFAARTNDIVDVDSSNNN